MTGQYPKWWIGKRFKKPTRGWIIGPERSLVRDGPQRQMTARQGEFGTGTIPLASFAGRPVMVPGGTGSIDTMSVAHETDGTKDGVSTATYKSFEQGSEKMQSESIDWIWVDERCSEEIYSELVARTTATDGIIFLSYTPLKGGGELTFRFLNEYSADRVDIRIDAGEAKHISAERRQQLEESYLPHEREARIHGIPQLGIARVFPFPLESLMRNFTPETDIKSWARWCVGIDFGYGHPFAAALCAWVPEPEEFWVVDGFKMERGEAFYHVKRMAGLCRGLRIPIAWPHDGLQHEKGSALHSPTSIAGLVPRCWVPCAEPWRRLSRRTGDRGNVRLHEARHIRDCEPHERTGRGDTELPPRRGLQGRPAPRRSDQRCEICVHDAAERQACRGLRSLRAGARRRHGACL